MELSSDNIEELAIAMSDNSAAIGNMDGVVFQNKSNYSSLDVDQVISDAQECLLNSSIEPIRSCSFNDILDDICEMNKTIELEQTCADASTSQLPFTPVTDLAMGSPTFYHMPDISLQQTDYAPDCSFTNQTDFLQPLSQWPEYLLTPPPPLNTMQEVPQLASVPTPPPPPPPPSSPRPQETPAELSTVNDNWNLDKSQLVPSTPINHLQFINNYHFNFTPTLPHSHFVQQCEPPNVNAQFFPPVEKNINFLMLKEPAAPSKKRPRIQKQTSFDWARVVPRKPFVQPAEVMILRPLRTRKVMSLRPNFDLSSYFDTSTITIPMIRERPRGKNANRRKQKLRAIPGADNLMFEVQMQPTIEGNDDSIKDDTKLTDMNNNGDQLYPETEIPELDEIFKRKRRGYSTRRNTQTQNRAKTPTSSHSMEEDRDLSAIILSPEPPTEQPESNSDMDSDDAPLTAVKSMKCQNCRKLFKTCRSLTIHSKRCGATRHSSPIGDKPLDIMQSSRVTRRGSMQSNSSKENLDTKKSNESISAGQRPNARPLTRSQTNAAKRKAAESIDGDMPKKRFK